jgi:hypothetical protein
MSKNKEKKIVEQLKENKNNLNYLKERIIQD